MQGHKCPICFSVCREENITDSSSIQCPRCGQFIIARTAKECLKNRIFEERKRIIASSLIRTQFQNIAIDTTNLDLLFSKNDISILEKAERLLICLSEKTKFFGETINIANSNRDNVTGIQH